jgi:hypothetical protein
MAATNYSKNNAKDHRRPGVRSRLEYQQTIKADAMRGQDLPQAKLLDMDVIDIRSAKRQRDNMLKYIKENLSNDALSKKYSIHARTLEKVLSRETWCHLP